MIKMKKSIFLLSLLTLARSSQCDWRDSLGKAIDSCNQKISNCQTFWSNPSFSALNNPIITFAAGAAATAGACMWYARKKFAEQEQKCLLIKSSRDKLQKNIEDLDSNIANKDALINNLKKKIYSKNINIFKPRAKLSIAKNSLKKSKAGIDSLKRNGVWQAAFETFNRQIDEIENKNTEMVDIIRTLRTMQIELVAKNIALHQENISLKSTTLKELSHYQEAASSSDSLK